MKSIALTFGALAALAFMLPVAAQKHTDPAFLTDAIRGDLGEIKLGQLAEEKGQSEGVRDFGHTLMSDHQKAMKKAADLAKTLGVTAPTDLTPEAQKTYDQLSRLSGAEFDRQFVMHMVMDHQKDIAKYQEESKSSVNPKVADLAEDTLPTLRDHLETAQSLQKKLNG